MSLGIRPTDALVHRLLQQNTRLTTDTSHDHVLKKGQVIDQVNISSEARKGSEPKQSGETYSPDGQSVAYKQKNLEARLLKMYSHSQER
ncbi:MAG: hypothetical protein Q9M18_07475 [Mariprofundaceae bacterium]|nr:hypothetical protein [Mariprofundaceae bacterium]